MTNKVVYLIPLIPLSVIAILIALPQSVITGETVYVCDLNIEVQYWFRRDFMQGDHLSDIRVIITDTNWHEKRIIELSFVSPRIMLPLWFEEEIVVKWIFNLDGQTIVYEDRFQLPWDKRLYGGVNRYFTVTFKSVPTGYYTLEINVNYPIQPEGTFTIYKHVSLYPPV